MTLVASGLFGDVLKHHDKKVEKIVYCTGTTTHEIECLYKFESLYGIPKVYGTKQYNCRRFYGKQGDGVYCTSKDLLIKRGPAIGVIMDYVGDLTLDDYNSLTLNQLQKVIFNVCYIIYTIVTNYSMVHGDLHRRNVVLKKAKPFSKTYYINDIKYKISNQYYKVSIIDFDSCKPVQNAMEDIVYLMSFFEGKFSITDDFNSFFEANFDSYKV
jgi:hypothetical protein